MVSHLCSGEELLAWRRAQLALGGRSVDLDWLLDLQGELRWAELQRLRLRPELTVSLACSLEALAHLWRRHLDGHVPLQHLVGRCPWRDLDLQISAAALIPRQETELLIDLALDRLRDPAFAPHRRDGRWADLGTGSGAMAVALARALAGWHGHAVDLSSAALDLARINLQRLAPEGGCQVHLGNWWTPLRPWWGQFNLVVSNPPYIPSKWSMRLSLWFETMSLARRSAVVQMVLMLVGRSWACSSGVGSRGWLLIEHHHDQSEQVLQLMESSGLVAAEARCDLGGVKRFAMACQSPDRPPRCLPCMTTDALPWLQVDEMALHLNQVERLCFPLTRCRLWRLHLTTRLRFGR